MNAPYTYSFKSSPEQLLRMSRIFTKSNGGHFWKISVLFMLGCYWQLSQNYSLDAKFCVLNIMCFASILLHTFTSGNEGSSETARKLSSIMWLYYFWRRKWHWWVKDHSYCSRSVRKEGLYNFFQNLIPGHSWRVFGSPLSAVYSVSLWSPLCFVFMLTSI